jgi:hypothetical protein
VRPSLAIQVGGPVSDAFREFVQMGPYARAAYADPHAFLYMSEPVAGNRVSRDLETPKESDWRGNGGIRLSRLLSGGLSFSCT